MRFHSFLTKKCEIRSKSIDDLGVFAKEKILKGELISVWGGAVLATDEIEELGKKSQHYLTHPLPIYDNFYLGPINSHDIDDAERFNHSCNPNAGIKGQIILIARRDISENEEICFDYETTSIQEESFVCNCKSKNCRKIITGNSWKNPEFQKENIGFFSWYIEEKIRSIKN